MKPRKVRVKRDPVHPAAPCVLVGGSPRRFIPGETVRVVFTDRWRAVPGLVREYVDGVWVIQVRTMPEGSDPTCTCTVDVRGVAYTDPDCLYHTEEEEQ